MACCSGHTKALPLANPPNCVRQMSGIGRLRALIGLTLSLAAIPLYVLVSTFASSEELTRIRNSLIAEVGMPADFAWTPEAAPDDFAWERASPPEDFRRIGSSIRSSIRATSSDAAAVDLSLAIARHMSTGPGIGEGIMSNSVDTYRIILSEARGYCSDYTQVFNALALASDVPVREWGMSFDGFSGDGHAFNEVFDREHGKWVFIDSFFSFFVVNAQTGVPLSVIEFHDALRSGRAKRDLIVRRIVPGRFGFPSSDRALEYYGDGVNQFFLWFGNDVFSYDSHPVIARLSTVSRSLEQAVAILLGVHPQLRILPTDSNATLIAELRQTRLTFFISAALLPLLIIGLILEAMAYRRLKSRLDLPAAQAGQQAL